MSFRNLIIVAIAVLGFGGVAFALPYYSTTQTMIPQITSSYDIGTSTATYRNLYIDRICLSTDCKSAWPTGGSGGTGTASTSFAATYPVKVGVTAAAITYSVDYGTTTSNTWAGTQTFTNAPVLSSLSGVLKGNSSSAVSVAANGTDFTLISATTCGAGNHISAITAAGAITCSADTGGTGGTGTVSTSTVPTVGNLAYWTSNGFPSLLGSVATSTLTPSSPLTGSFTVIGTGSLGLDTSGTWSGNAGTVTNGVYTTTFNNLFDVRLTATTSLPQLATLAGVTSLGSYSGLIAGKSGALYAVSTTSMNASITGSAGLVANALTMNNGGSGAASGSTFDGSVARTISYNTIGAQPTLSSPTWPIKLTGTTLSTDFSTTTNNGMSAGNLYVGTGGLFLTAASSSIFGYTPLNPTRNINTTWPMTGGGDLSADRTIAYAGFGTTTDTGIGNNLSLYTNATGVVKGVSTSTPSLPAYMTYTGGTLGSFVGGTSGTFSINALPVANGGTASTTALGGILVGNGSSAIKSLVVGTNLTFDGTTLSATGGGSSFPFTPTTNYGAAANSTSTPIWFTTGIMASTTNNYFAGETIDDAANADSKFQVGTTSHEWVMGYKMSDMSFRLSSSTTLGTSDAITVDKNLKVTLGGALAVTGATTLATSLTGLAYTSSGLVSAITNGVIGTNGVLGISGGVPAYVATSSLNVAISDTTGTLTVARGGTGAVTITGLVLGNGASAMTAYGGVTCTNQFLRALSAAGASTCATVGAADVSLANLTATDNTLTFSGTYNGATARTIGLNLAQPNTWTGLQQFSNASSTQFSAASQTFYIDTTGHVTAKNTVSGYSGVLSPSRYLSLGGATTTTPTTGTTTGYLVPVRVAPFNGTVRSVVCVASTTAAFFGVAPFIGTTPMTPAYFIASSTGGTITFTGNNTFTKGQNIGMAFGTSTASNANLSLDCEFETTETP